MYTAIVLHEPEQEKLLNHFRDVLPPGWKTYAHHMTINFGSDPGPASSLVGQEAEVKVCSLASNDLVMAVGVESEIPSVNVRKHITLAVNVNGGGKPKQSNDLTEWEPVETFILRGKIMVCD